MQQNEALQQNANSGSYHAVASEEPEGYKLISEGTARILAGKNNEVFYNNVQVFNRDISTLAIKMFAQIKAEEAQQRANKRRNNQSNTNNTAAATPAEASTSTSTSAATAAAAAATAATAAAATAAPTTEQTQTQQQQQTEPFVAPKLSVLEALSATGLRSIRYWKEIEGLEKIVANDLSADAVETIRRNVQYNQIPEGCIIPNHADATEFMYLHRKPEQQFDVVDLDPYGTAANFLDGAIQCVKEGGLLCVTCTDMGVLAGSNPETCYAKYGSIPTKGRYCHEMALRIVLSSIQQHASRYKRYVVPLLSLSVDFYVRLFMRVYTSPSEVKKAIGKVANVYQCAGCDTFHLQTVGRVVEEGKSVKFQNSSMPAAVAHSCSECNSVMKIGGPIWVAPMHDVSFVARMQQHLQLHTDKFATHKRIAGMLGIVEKELPDVPLYYDLPSLSNRLHATTPKISIMRSALANAGFRVSQAHCNADALKTDAPNSVVMDLMRGWVKQSPVRAPSPTSPAAFFLAKEPIIQADFTERPEMDLRSSKTGVTGFLPNPEAFWGPKPRAGRSVDAVEKKKTKKSNAEIGANGKQRESKKQRYDEQQKQKQQQEAAASSSDATTTAATTATTAMQE